MVVFFGGGALSEVFQPFIEKEIRVIIFYGHPRTYLKLLYKATLFDFVNNR